MRKTKISDEDFPLVYVGPPTRWGMTPGTRLHALKGAGGKPMRGRSGLLGYTDTKGDAWQLPPSQVVPYEAPRRRRPSMQRVREMMRR